MRRELPTLDRLHKLLRFYPETGLLRWKITKANAIAGDVAGCYHNSKNVPVRIDGTLYRAHRIAWLMHYGTSPPHTIDHANGNPHDNRIVNLRAASFSQNSANSKLRRTSTSGFKGVLWNKQCKKWQARIRHNGKTTHLGLFADAAKAHAAYSVAANLVHGSFARVR